MGSAGLKHRRREVAECLAAYGFARGPRRLLRDAQAPEAEAARARRLRLALETLGGAFAAFGLYASGRADIFGAGDCMELAALTDAAEPMPVASVTALFEREFGRAPEAVFSYFEESPFESRLLSQSHRARLLDGTNAVVKFARPAEQFADDLALLALLKDSLAAPEWACADAAELLADFQQSLRLRLDLLNEATAFEALARDAEGFEALKAPAVFRDICSPRVLTVEELTGAPFEDSPRYDARDATRLTVASEESARLLCLVWLRQALLGSAFPSEARASNVLFVARTQLAFTGGAFATLRPESQTNVLDYLIAVSSEEPERACTFLLRELKGEGEPGRERRLRQGFRQVVPFRDGGWEGGAGLTLAEHLFLHWRLASEHGYAPRAHLVPFYRGLFAVAALAQRVSPDTDALLEALRDVRLMSGLAQLREMVGLEEMGGRFEQYASLMTEMPQRLDEALTLASGGGARMRVRVGETESERRRKNSAASVMSLLAVVVSLALLLRAASGGAVWLQRAAVLVFTLCGVMLLRAASRIK